MIGTIRYASVNTHQGIEQSRRDDLESLGFVLIYFLKGELLWSGLQGNMTKQQKYDKIRDIKLNTDNEELTQNCPEEFSRYFNYVRGLNFEDRPDYSYLRQLFRDLYEHKYEYDFEMDWMKDSSPYMEHLKDKEIKESNLNV